MKTVHRGDAEDAEINDELAQHSLLCGLCVSAVNKQLEMTHAIHPRTTRSDV
jgi:hypothetical protein